jgi:hypothetical protein
MKVAVPEWDARVGVEVEITGIGSVMITATDEGIVADIFAEDDKSESVASAWATHTELNSEEDN